MPFGSISWPCARSVGRSRHLPIVWAHVRVKLSRGANPDCRSGTAVGGCPRRRDRRASDLGGAHSNNRVVGEEPSSGSRREADVNQLLGPVAGVLCRWLGADVLGWLRYFRR
jgi:hypothetical protein